MFAKIEVNGPGAAPLYQFLTGSVAIEWNFAKFLVDGEGAVIKRYSPKATPEEIATDVAAALGAE